MAEPAQRGFKERSIMLSLLPRYGSCSRLQRAGRRGATAGSRAAAAGSGQSAAAVGPEPGCSTAPSRS